MAEPLYSLTWPDSPHGIRTVIGDGGSIECVAGWLMRTLAVEDRARVHCREAGTGAEWDVSGAAPGFVLVGGTSRDG